MSKSKGKHQRLDVSDSEYSDNFDEEESDTESVSSSCNEKISNINPRKRFRRNSSELNKQFQHSYSKMADSKEVGKISTQQKYDATQTGNRKRCYSKNALNARENRIKKKMYVENLEKSVEKYRIKNKQLTFLLENQKNMMSDMKKELQYLKSVLANSKDISRLLRGLNQSTGMPVTSSINKNISHPWTETNSSCLENLEFIDNPEYNLPLDTFLPDPSLTFDESLKPMDDNFKFSNEECSLLNEDFKVQLNDEHNYNAKRQEKFDIQDVGVCLHISNHMMSLEFCPTCSDKATSAWKI